MGRLDVGAVFRRLRDAWKPAPALEPQVPYPPREFMEYVNGPAEDQLAVFQYAGPFLADMVAAEDMLGEGVRFLDIGSGCGRLARHLLDRPLAGYTGFDRHRGMVEWCQAHIQPLKPNFAFHHFALASAYDVWDKQPGGGDASRFRFPFEAEAFDRIFLSSVFTHMPIGEIENYLREMLRVLSARGRVLLSVFQSDGAPYIRDEINFFYPEQAYLDLFRETGFDSKLLFVLGHEAYRQYFYALTKQVP